MTGNTKKVALQIEKSALKAGHQVTTVEVSNETGAEDCNFLDYDFIFSGSGVYSWLPPEDMLAYFTKQNKKHMAKKDIVPCSPRLPGKKAVVYCTFGGPHTGENEAVIVPKYFAQLFDHLGFEIVAEWRFPGAFNKKGFERFSTGGRMGDIMGRPNENDLKHIAELTCGVLGM